MVVIGLMETKLYIALVGSVMQVSISSETIPPSPLKVQISRTRLEGSKAPLPATIIVYKTLPLGQNRESKAPPLGHKIRKFHECIYKLWHYLNESFVVSTDETVF